MTSYVFELKKCTNCENEFVSNSLLSSNSKAAVFYTDGYMLGPMYSEDIYVVKCPKCNSYLWKNTLPTLKHISELEYFRKYHDDNPEKYFNYHINFEYLLTTPIWTNAEQEKYIRISAWWSFNDKYRAGKFETLDSHYEKYLKESGLQESREFLITAEQERNLKRILELLDLQDEHERLMTAEIHRELGDFDQCINLLDFDFSESRKVYAGAIKKLGKEQVNKVDIIS